MVELLFTDRVTAKCKSSCTQSPIRYHVRLLRSTKKANKSSLPQLRARAPNEVHIAPVFRDVAVYVPICTQCASRSRYTFIMKRLYRSGRISASPKKLYLRKSFICETHVVYLPSVFIPFGHALSAHFQSDLFVIF